MSSGSAVIRVEGVSKSFSIYERPNDRLKQMLVPRMQKLLGKKATAFHRDFHALNNVSFEVGRGETVGILGRNGSGKSTLLQIITGTMTPTSGRVLTQGRTGALLELGSGFNPDFSGRENVFLNGGLLGLTHSEVEERFDYIAGFADIGDHLDQPVKTYSSGMMLRLAFAVQAAIETEILIIDEALAVGDARFQLKCFRRLEEIKASGTTILFVSHATELVRSFCDFGLVLERGNAVFWGNAKAATVKYLELLFPEQACEPAPRTEDLPNAPIANLVEPVDVISAAADVHETLPWLNIDERDMGGETFGAGGATLNWVRISGLRDAHQLEGGQDLKIRCQFSWQPDFIAALIEGDQYDPNITLGVSLADRKGNYLFGCNGFDSGLDIACLEKNQSTVEFRLRTPYLSAGVYFVTFAIALGNQAHHIQLKWYDCAYQFNNIQTTKEVYGVFAIEYQMYELSGAKSAA
ncbi:MAG TPA: ABC transporter ATP-binding protein [Blastocatellia bacterium]|nr:ABC transporter ATP-binding protein [Blastocatellia bacterium]